MLPRILLLVILFASHALASAQGTIRGKISDETGETLIGATVVLQSDPSIGTTTDLDGNYSLRIDTPGEVTIVVSFVSFESQVATYTVADGSVVVANFILGQKRIELEGVVIEGRARKASDSYLDRMKANAPANLDFIGRDMMLKTGDTDAAAAVKRVSGVSTVGSFVTVRGLADRYLVTVVNGSRIPTLDPFTNNLRLDLFPTGLMDNIIITKTATPDLPGDWSGAYLSMNTSDYPPNLQVTVATSVGYNTNSTFQDVISSQTSPTDWTGRDDGTRGIPDGVPDAVEDYPTFIDPTVFQQLGLLGLQGYLDGYGITSSTPGFSGTSMSTGNTLQHLALTELGMLPPALLYDPSAVQSGVNTYNSTYNLAYFSPTLNAEMASLNTKWDNSRWRVGTTNAGPNITTAFAIGNQIELAKDKKEPKQLGYLVGLRYTKETQYDPNSSLLRTIERYDDPIPTDEFKRKGEQQISQVTSGWNTLGSLSLKLNRNNSFSLLAMGNTLGQNNARYLVFKDPTITSETFASEDQFWEQRRLWVFQYGSKHLIPALNLTVTPDVSYSTGQRDVLDMKTVQYILPPEGQPITDVDGALTPPGRIYRFLDEQMLDARLNMELPLNDDPTKVRKLKFGGCYRWNQRTNEQLYYVVNGAPGPTQWEEPGRFEMRPDGRFTSSYAPFGSFKDNDIGILKVASGYLMSDYALTSRLRVAGGVRAEYTDLISDIYRFWDEGIAANDTIRGTVGDLSINGSGSPEPQPAVPGTIEQWDLLPSINFIYKLRNDNEQPVNLRFSYFRSLGRPSFREFSVVQYYDYLLQAPVYGNPDLEMTRIDNVDIRLEHFFRNGANISITGFYKYFTNHIELLQTAQGGFTWRNANRSEVIGGELEGRMNLTRALELRGNLTVMESRSELTTFLQGEFVEYSTPMFGQAPYIVNTTLSYGLDSIGLTVSASYNVQGPKLAVTNSELDPNGIRAFEMPRHVIDLTVRKTLGKHWSAWVRVRDMLNQPIRRTYLFASGYVGDFDSYAYGTEILLTLAYTIR